MGSPLRPAPEDIQFYRDVLKVWSQKNARGSVRTLIFGVTPELHSLAQESGCQLLAVDRNPDMIKTIWPGEDGTAVCCDWRDVPLPRGGTDVVMCDGGLHLIPYRDEQLALIAEIRRLLRKGGRVAFRLFLPSEHGETPEEVLADLAAGKIPNLNCLKLRLGTAMMSTSEEGVSLHDVWYQLRSFYNNAEWSSVAEKLGWEAEHLEVIESYRDSAARYHFVSLRQVVQLFTEGDKPGFELASIWYPEYPMGERCPLVSFYRT